MTTFNFGDKVQVKYDDNFPEISGKVGVVTKPTQDTEPPFWIWIDIDGEEYPARGADCVRVDKDEYAVEDLIYHLQNYHNREPVVLEDGRPVVGLQDRARDRKLGIIGRKPDDETQKERVREAKDKLKSFFESFSWFKGCGLTRTRDNKYAIELKYDPNRISQELFRSFDGVPVVLSPQTEDFEPREDGA